MIYRKCIKCGKFKPADRFLVTSNVCNACRQEKPIDKEEKMVYEEVKQAAIKALNLKTGEESEFDSIDDASKALNIKSYMIKRVLDGKIKKVKGFSFTKI